MPSPWCCSSNQIIQTLNALVVLQGSPFLCSFFSPYFSDLTGWPSYSSSSSSPDSVIFIWSILLIFFFFAFLASFHFGIFFSNYIFLLNFIFVSWYAFYVSLSSSFLLSWHIFISYFSCLSTVIITILHSFSGRSFRGFTAVELERGRSWVGFSCYFFFLLWSLLI